MNFRTKVEIEGIDYEIDYHKKLFFIGSCFTDNIGKKVENAWFQTRVNPFGVLYNPVSVKNSLELLINDKTFTDDDINFYNEMWYSFYHHSSFSHPDKDKCLFEINRSLADASLFFQQSDMLFITFGTAWCYIYKKTNKVVSNCHKIPASEFDRKLLTVNEIVADYAPLIAELKKVNPKLKIVFTISPVRHLKDGAHGNQVSKATLLLAVSQLANKIDDVFYFPAYEIVMDELRDYRFYADDMTHPNGLSISYLWEKFRENLFSAETKSVYKEVDKISKLIAHRPLHTETETYRKFAENRSKRLMEFELRYPYIVPKISYKAAHKSK